jgi:hypothetical protein
VTPPTRPGPAAVVAAASARDPAGAAPKPTSRDDLTNKVLPCAPRRGGGGDGGGGGGGGWVRRVRVEVWMGGGAAAAGKQREAAAAVESDADGEEARAGTRGRSHKLRTGGSTLGVVCWVCSRALPHASRSSACPSAGSTGSLFRRAKAEEL